MKNQTLAQWVKSARKLKNLTQTDLGEALGRTKQNVYSWEKGIHKPSPEQIKQIMQITGMFAPQEIVDIVGIKEESQITDSNVSTSIRRVVSVPRISWIKAGAFECSNDTDETCEPDYYVETAVRVSSRAFALTVDNDSMIDLDGGPYSFPEGSDIICDPDKECTVGSFVIAKDTRTQKTTFKKLTSDGLHLYLSPLNKRYNPIPIDNEHIRLIAKVIDTSIKLP